MKIIRHIGKCAVGTVILPLLLIMTAVAADSMKVMETHTGESNIIVYVKGIGEDASGASVHIGTAPCASVESGSLSELKYPVKTLVMLDNSLSIPQQERETIAGILQNIISDRESYEEIAIATFDDELRYLSDYTSDYTTLKSAIDSISYEDLETHLTSVLYDLISREYIEKTESSYWRIVVITDGIDDQSIDSTQEELHTLMKEKAIPIYTVGMRTDKNNEKLAELFALSRLSNADSFVLDDVDNLLDINTALNADRSIVRFSITPDSELMDGSRKTVMISLPSGSSVSVELTMPQQGIPRPESVTTEPETYTQPETTTTIELETDTDNASSVPSLLLPIVVACAVALIAIAVTVLIMTAKNRKKDEKPEPDKTENGNDRNQHDVNDNRYTVIKEGTVVKSPVKEGDTLYIFGSNTPCNLVFTDMASPVRTFQYPLKKAAIIGADPTCEITISGDDYISGRHCRIETRNGKLYLQDLQSTNGTFVNDARITTETEIVAGDILQVGDTALKLTIQR